MNYVHEYNNDRLHHELAYLSPEEKEIFYALPTGSPSRDAANKKSAEEPGRFTVADVFEHTIIARCQLHEMRNIQDKRPQHLGGRPGNRCARPTPTLHCSP